MIYVYVLVGLFLWSITALGISLAVEWFGIHVLIGLMIGLVASTYLWLRIGTQLRKHRLVKALYIRNSPAPTGSPKRTGRPQSPKNPRNYLR